MVGKVLRSQPEEVNVWLLLWHSTSRLLSLALQGRCQCPHRKLGKISPGCNNLPGPLTFLIARQNHPPCLPAQGYPIPGRHDTLQRKFYLPLHPLSLIPPQGSNEKKKIRASKPCFNTTLKNPDPAFKPLMDKKPAYLVTISYLIQFSVHSFIFQLNGLWGLIFSFSSLP